MEGGRWGRGRERDLRICSCIGVLIGSTECRPTHVCALRVEGKTSLIVLRECAFCGLEITVPYHYYLLRAVSDWFVFLLDVK